MSERNTSAMIKSIGIILGLFILGYCLYAAIAQKNYVTVKGMATREVKANIAVMEIDYREVGSNLIALSKKISHDQTAVLVFLKQQGFQNTDIEMVSPKVTDAFANSYSGNTTARNRYTVSGGLIIHSNQVDLVRKLNQQISQLLTQGIPLSFDNASVYPNPSYFYTTLDSIRPQMLADANQSARLLATQFAKDAGATLGTIRRANQGQFQMMSRDSDETGSSQQQLTAMYKKIRLINTVDYYLK